MNFGLDYRFTAASRTRGLLLFGVLLTAVKVFKPAQWQCYADPRITLAMAKTASEREARAALEAP
jgi:hypothetical protein